MELPKLEIGQLKPKIPIIQGGMAVRISTARLAAAVADEGGIGIIAASGMSPRELKDEIRKARELSSGIIGINIMFAASQFADIVNAAIEERIDLIISGAGFSRDLFIWGKEAGIPVVPIVSSVRLAKISQNLGAAAIVVEGKEAGGHLGTDISMRQLVPEIKKNVKIPVIAAGGIVDGEDLAEAFQLGADGVQMGIRFAASEESNAAPNLKEYYVRSTRDDIVIIQSPVGLPGRALKNEFTDKLSKNLVKPPDQCGKCLKNCVGNFCIMKALVNAQQGKLENGLIFSGEYIDKITKIMPVREIIHTILQDAGYLG